MLSVYKVFQKTRWGAEALFKARITAVTPQGRCIRDGRTSMPSEHRRAPLSSNPSDALMTICHNKWGLSQEVNVLCHSKPVSFATTRK